MDRLRIRKNWAGVWITVIVAVMAMVCFADERIVMNLNNDWGFWRGDVPGGERVDFDDSQFARVAIPHSMRLEKKHCSGADQVYQGIGWYRRYLTIPTEWKGKRVVLDFEGVMMDSMIYLNGCEIGQRHGGYIGFSLDITDFVRWGETNVLALKVSNKDNPDTPPGKPLANLDFHYYGGIYRDVVLRVTDPLHITDPLAAGKTAGGGVFVTYPKVSRQLALVNIKTHVNNLRQSATRIVVRTVLTDAQKRIVATNESAPILMASGADLHVEQELQVQNPKLWDTRNPHLYTVTSEIVSGGRVVDSIQTQIGIRKIAFKPDGFYLNDEKLYLRGVNRHQSYQNVGDAAPNSMQRRDALQIQENGFNFVRATHYPQDPAFLEACDELGLLVIVCQPGWQYFGKSREFYDRTHRDTREMIRRDRNHPCVVLWESSLNETGYSEQWARESVEIAHQEYPGDQMYTAADYGYHGKYYDVCYKVVDCNLEGVQKDFAPAKPFLTREWGDWGHQSLRRQGEAAMLDQVHARQEQLNGRGYPDWGGLDANKRIAGYCLWSWNDYTRGGAPNTLGSGAVDIDRHRKYSAEWLATMKSPRDPQYGPVVFIASTHSPESALEVEVFSNADSVKLFRNEQLIGVQTREQAARRCPNIVAKGGSPIFTFTLPNFEPGKLRAEAFLDGKIVKVHEVRTPGKAVRLLVEPAVMGIRPVADGSDLVPVYIKAVDEHGTVVPDFQGKVHVSVEGQGQLVGAGIPRVRVENQFLDGGIGFFFVRTSNQAGKIICSASSKGLAAGRAIVDTQPFRGIFAPGPQPAWKRTEKDLETSEESSQNLAVGSCVTASSEQPQNPSANVVDDDPSTRWAAENGNLPQHITVDLGQAMDVGSVEILWEQSLNYTFHLECSSDRFLWIPLGKFVSQKDRSLVPVGRRIRYLNVNISQVERHAGWASIREIRIFPPLKGLEILPGNIIPDSEVESLISINPSVTGREPNKLRDGKTSIGTGWLAQSTQCPQTVILKLKNPTTLTGSRIYWEKDSSQYTYNLEVSIDGKTWQKVFEQHQVAGQFFKPEFFPTPVQNVQYVRIVLTDVRSGAGVDKIGMAEWQLFKAPVTKDNEKL